MSENEMVLEGSVEILMCSCCGKGVRDNAEENVSHGEVPYPHDRGFGYCRDCGGVERPVDVRLSDLSEGELRKTMGWASTIFFDARIQILRERLNPANVAKLDAMSYARKVAAITRLIEKGAMV